MADTKKPAKEYLFPSSMAKFMEKVDQRVQYESTMMSVCTILVGMIILAVYMVFFNDVVSTFMKVMITINTVAGFFFLGSSLVTTYQQYITYIESMELFSNLEGLEENVEKTKPWKKSEKSLSRF